jgi:branched-chain amino acid transport system permease protein
MTRAGWNPANWNPAGWQRCSSAAVGWLALIAICGQVMPAQDLFPAAGILVAILYAQSVSFSIGFGGVATFGNQAFYGAAGYLVAWLSINASIQNILLLLLIGLAAGVVGSSLTVFLVRGQTGFVFGLLTLAIGQTVYEFVSGTSYVGGSGGYAGVSRGTLVGIDLNNAMAFYWFLAILVAVVTIVLYAVRSSAYGRILSAIRQNAVRVETLGAPVNRYKGIAVLISGGLAGIAGAMYAVTYGSTDPSMFYWVAGAAPILAGILGGMRTLIGPIVGATIYGGVLYAFSLTAKTGQLYVSLIVLAIFLLMPDGVVPAAVSGARLAARRLSALPIADRLRPPRPPGPAAGPPGRPVAAERKA